MGGGAEIFCNILERSQESLTSVGARAVEVCGQWDEAMSGGALIFCDILEPERWQES